MIKKYKDFAIDEYFRICDNHSYCDDCPFSDRCLFQEEYGDLIDFVDEDIEY